MQLAANGHHHPHGTPKWNCDPFELRPDQCARKEPAVAICCRGQRIASLPSSPGPHTALSAHNGPHIPHEPLQLHLSVPYSMMNIRRACRTAYMTNPDTVLLMGAHSPGPSCL